MKKSAIPIIAAITYLLIGGGWILGGGALTEALYSGSDTANFELIKGLAFVAISAAVIFALMRWIKSPDISTITFGEIAEEFKQTILIGERTLNWLSAAMLILFATVLTALLLVLASVRMNTITTGEQAAAALRHSISSQIGSSIKIVDLTLAEIAHALASTKPEFVSAELPRYLAQSGNLARAIWVVDAKGRRILDSDDSVKLGVDLSQREYFLHHRDSGLRGFFLGTPLRSVTAGTWFISASHAIRSPSGDFLGVVVAALDAEQFGLLWRGPLLGDDGNVTLFRTDGTLLMRSPFVENSVGKSFLDTYAWRELVPLRNTGVYQRQSAVDGKSRIYAYGPVPQYDELMVFVGLPTEPLLANWRVMSAMSIGAYLLFSGLVATLSLILLNQLRLRLAAQRRASELARLPLQNRNPVISMARAGTITFMNDAARQLLQSVADTPAGRQLDKALRDITRETKPGDMEVRVGSQMLSASYTPHPDFCDIYLTDISQIHEFKKKLELFFELPFIGMAITSPETKRWINFNDELCNILGYSRQELAGKSWAELTHPDDLAADIGHFEQVMAGESDGYCIDKRFIRANGAIVYATINVKAVRRADRSIEFFIATIEDITKEKAITAQLVESESKFKGLVEQSLVGIYIIDDTTMYYANPRTAEIFGYAPDEILGPKMEKLVHPDDWPLVQDNIRKCLTGSINSIKYEFRGRRHDGSVVHIGSHGSRGEYAGKPVIIGVLQDVGDRLETEKKINDYVARLEHSIKATTNAISDMVELRDPYTAGHERRVAEIAAAIGSELGMSASDVAGLSVMGHVHDVGKIAVPAEILSKPRQLSAIEFELVKEHAEKGYEILKNIEFPWPVALAVRQHHERMDGSGYPQGLKGEEIVLAARILAVADVVESMASHRPYRPALGLDKALAEVEKNAGLLYDTEVAAACLRLFRDKKYALPT